MLLLPTTSLPYLLFHRPSLPYLLLFLLTLPHCVTSNPLPCPDACVCESSTVKCTYQQLSHLPDGIPPDTISLDLSHNRLRDDSWDGLLAAVAELTSLKNLILTDNIFTTIPANGLPNIKLDLLENPLHCNCNTYALPLEQFVYPDLVKCATTTNPDVQDMYLTRLSKTLLNCEEEQLIVPADITLYKINSKQIIPCRKSKPGTVYWIKRGVTRYKTEKEDCSLVLRYMTSADEGVYKVKYIGLFGNQTTLISVKLKRESSEPYIDDSSTLLEVQKKGTAKLTCKASGAPPPSIEWFYRNETVRLINDDNIVLVDNATLIITDITREEVFTCRASNLLGTSEAKFVVKTVDKMRGAVFEWLAPLSVALLIVTGAGSVGYIFYSKQKLARLKQRCSSPGGSSATGTVFENCEALPSTITQCEGYKMLAISTASPPHQLICPITRECMKNPVVANDGFSYEEKAILAWFKRNGTSPMTNGEISKRLIQNHNLRTLIRDIMDKTSISDSFINVENVSPSTSARSSNLRAKVVTSPSHSRLSRVAPDDTSAEIANINTTSSARSSSAANNPTTSRPSVNTDPSTSSSSDTAGPSNSTSSSLTAGLSNSTSSSLTEPSRSPNTPQHDAENSRRGNPAAELSNVSTRARRFISDGSSTSGTVSSAPANHGSETALSDQAQSEPGTLESEPPIPLTDNQTTGSDNAGSVSISNNSSRDSQHLETDGIIDGDEISRSHI